MAEDKTENGKDGGAKNALLGALGNVNIPTTLLIAVLGGGNLLATNSGNAARQADIDRAVREIHEMHDALESALKRQKGLTDSLEASLASQKKILDGIDALQRKAQ